MHAPVDHKTALQEELAKRGQRVEYVTLSTEGPPHNRTFTCAAVVDGTRLGAGTGRTKKDAEQEAALEAARPPRPDSLSTRWPKAILLGR